MKRAIEEYFPIVEINRLAVPERNAFKPIYQMHKWFARRSSSVFRAILLGALKPAGTDIMKEFYKDHTNDPDTKGKVILDPFMGGGTTVVEALRLGCKVIGIDLNPVAWFIVKTEVEPVDINELKAAFERLAKRKVEWSGKPLKETLLDLYKTECPGCGNKDADIIYTFWVKSAPCTTATCKAFTPLFSDYIIAQKKPSIRYFPDVVCPNCKEKFDWEREPAALVSDEKLMVNAAKFSAGEGRTSARWTYSSTESVRCPWCQVTVKPKPASIKLKRKKVPLSVLFCPHCEEVWQYRGPLGDSVECPTCKHTYNPKEANIPDKGKFICRGTCNGNVDKIITAIRKLPEDQLLPIKPYGIEGYCERCATTPKKRTPRAPEGFFDSATHVAGDSLIWKNNGKFFKRITPHDVRRYQQAAELWQQWKEKLPYPKSEIPDGSETHRLHEHHYRYWWQMFNERQLLALSTLLKAIDEEENQTMKEMLLSAFQGTIEGNNVFATYHRNRDCVGRIFARHDYQPKITFIENNVWGNETNSRTLLSCWEKITEGKEFNFSPYDVIITSGGSTQKVPSREKIQGNSNNLTLHATDSKLYAPAEERYDMIITDPPYAGNVNYSELADFFYVWLRLILRSKYKEFAPEFTPKVDEIIENRTRGISIQDFRQGLKNVFSRSSNKLKDDGLLVFTFHHAEDSAWESLLDAVLQSGFYIEAIFPIHGESEVSLHLMDKEAISYDLIHVCRKRAVSNTPTKRSWASVRHEIRQRAREEARLIESGRYGNEPLSPSDINILLIGKCLELYSKHYGAIVDHEDNPVPITRALKEIKMLVDQIVTKERPLPTELEDIDRASYIYFTTLCGQREIKSDDVSKSTRGIIEPSELREYGLIIKGREKRGRSFEVKLPVERLDDLKLKFQDGALSSQTSLFGENGDSRLPSNILFVDCVHLLLGLAEVGENILPWLEKFRGLRPQIRAACEYLASRNKVFESSARKVLGLLDERTLFTNT